MEGAMVDRQQVPAPADAANEEMADVVGGLAARLQMKYLLRHYDSTLLLALFSFVNGCLSIGLMTTAARLTGAPFIFPSLGPTAYLSFSSPTAPAAAPRNAILGHTIGATVGWLTLTAFRLNDAGPALGAGISWPRVLAAALSLGFTCAGMVLFRAPHPAGAATTLIVSLGLLPQLWQVGVLLLAVVLVTAQAVAINRLAGLPYPLWGPVTGAVLPFRAQPAPAPAREPGVALLRRADSGETIPLTRHLTSLGRSMNNTVVVSDPRASRRHAFIEREGDNYWLEDLRGLNGTWLNGYRLASRAPLRAGDNIGIGGTTLTFHTGATAMGQSGDAQVVPGQDRPPAMAGIAPASAPEGATQLVAGSGISTTPATDRAATGLGTAAGSPVQISPHQAGVRLRRHVDAGPAAGRDFVVDEAGAILGRARKNAIAIPDNELSREHARVAFENGDYWLSDLGSTNGTWVNERRLIAPYRLRSGDSIGCGMTRLRVTLDPEPLN
jgi:pSer/pThr/pTyr-binding forkhead associated (FHA) protein